MMKPKYSVIIPTLNEEKFLPNLLHSLVQQTNAQFEVIVVDGHSKDRTVSRAKRFLKKLQLRVFESNRGVSCQRNVGARMARSKWLVFIDADSVLMPQFFEKITDFITRKKPQFFTTWLKSDGEKPEDAIVGFLLNMGIEGGVFIEKPWAPGPLTVVRKDAFFLVGGYNEQVSYGEDHELGVMIYNRGIQFDVLREMLYIHSFRRYRKEGNLKMMHRHIRSSLQIIFTNKGMKHMPGFIGGGAIFDKT